MVYPRACGGTAYYLNATTAIEGLSPRLRGNRGYRPSVLDDKRSIPALAGEPARWRSTGAQDGVYPRACGGTPRPHLPCRGYRGLSPRLRGNPRHPGPPNEALGSIPALAGEPSGRIQEKLLAAVYPRACGGTPRAVSSDSLASGLSPRLRGNRPRLRLSEQRPRSIPALAGEPAIPPPEAHIAAVYPRACGGTLPASGKPHRPQGLSPRLRGNRVTPEP